MEQFGVLAVIVGTVLVFVLTVLWIALPFAVFGVKEKLDSLRQRVDVLTRQQAETNQILRAGFNIPADEQ